MPGLGDEVQAQKAGILEIGDILVVKDTTASSSSITGAFMIAGGAGIDQTFAPEYGEETVKFKHFGRQFHQNNLKQDQFCQNDLKQGLGILKCKQLCLGVK